MTRPIQNHLMSLVMTLPGMYAGTNPHRPGLPHPAVDDRLLFGVLEEGFDPVLLAEA